MTVQVDALLKQPAWLVTVSDESGDKQPHVHYVVTKVEGGESLAEGAGSAFVS
ncbi:MAG: hypothetical protein JNM56_21625 [Planctomycetia bacterium]|nr:hypothetical protein [Planctomycetia bacterium]